MDVTSDRVNRVHASKLRLVKDMRQRSALREVSNMEAQRRTALQAVEQAVRDLATAEKSQAALEAELYRELAYSDSLSVEELDRRCHIVIGRLKAEIAGARRTLEEARAAQERAETAVFEARTILTKCSAASHKWQQIEGDVQRASDAHSEAEAEIEADDEVLLRYGSGSRTHTAGD
ncbi:YscO family type III secretion system apparatus protein [Bradyrhizobium sp. WSM 1738]|uniref:YscO family type III secretion system apparatus protein n=1 Tax=Bradyrhizobium hereditatis TaxID=2821405 RepID=UPI001CE27B69|nr:YscO family type III secretion system apparatus protein [Bradyrhizobium hereditatis]MCA6115046.1 YscO family type III secretion system apparatus protein [Bradyrhizobium hereditatis]